jgi:hypothetical protein
MSKLKEDSYCLVQANLDPIDPEVLKVAFRAVDELVDNDAYILSADAFGILANGLSAKTASTVAGELAKAGIAMEIVQEQQIPTSPGPHSMRRGGCSPEAFIATDSLGREVPIEWSKVLLVAAGMVPLREAKRVVQTRYKRPLGPLGVRITMGSGALMGLGAAVAAGYIQSKYAAPDRAISIRYKRESRGLLDVFINCEPYHYRIRADKFNFGGLGERISGKTMENFAQLVGDLTRYASGAALNRGAVAIREEGLEATFGYPSRHAFEEETIWLLYKLGLSRGRPWPWIQA